MGTEDGNIHKCSCSYNEQYLESYVAHTGPVHKVAYSPFQSGLFLSCSADWTVKLWRDENPEKPLLSFDTNTSYVSDVCWSSTNSTCFAAVSGGNTLEVWDLSIST